MSGVASVAIARGLVACLPRRSSTWQRSLGLGTFSCVMIKGELTTNLFLALGALLASSHFFHSPMQNQVSVFHQTYGMICAFFRLQNRQLFAWWKISAQMAQILADFATRASSGFQWSQLLSPVTTQSYFLHVELIVRIGNLPVCKARCLTFNISFFAISRRD